MAYLFGNFDGVGDAAGAISNPFFCSTYLDSPILIPPRTIFLTARVGLAERWSTSPRHVPRSEYVTLSNAMRDALKLWQAFPKMMTASIVDPEDYPSLFTMTVPHATLQTYRQALTTASTLMARVDTAWRTWAKSPRVSAPNPSTHALASRLWDHVSEGEASEYHRFDLWDRVIEAINKSQATQKKHTVTFSDRSGLKGAASLNIVLLDIPWAPTGERYIVLTWDQLLMVKDCAFMRLQVLRAIKAIYPHMSHMESHVLSLMRWHEACLTTYGNEGFAVLKQSEALSKAYLSTIAEDELPDGGPFPRMVDKVVGKEVELGCTPPLLPVTFRLVDTLESCASVREVVEIFGLQKISGHPMIDPARGSLSARDQARAPDVTLPLDAARMKWNACRLFLEGYVPHNGWPPLLFTRTDTHLYNLYSLQTRNIKRGSYPLEDWASCSFGKMFTFNFAPNFLELMDDKSISQYRSNISCNWDVDVPQISHRRLLLELISREEVSAREIVYRVMRRDIPLDWLIVALYPKEREFKLDPRMFSMMVFEMRLFFALTESNIADSVFKYLPQQTMTHSRLEIMKRFLTMTQPRRASDVIHLFLEIDLSRWNLRWRPLTVHGIGEVLDDMFGLPGVFTYVHEFFSKCMIVVRTRELEPSGIRTADPPPSDLLWYNHLGGFEGITQKLWTFCTYAMIDLAIHDMPLSYTLTGQADNQVLSVITGRNFALTRADQLRVLRDEITERVRDTCLRTNQEVKPEECLESTTVVTYSKDVFVLGVYHPTSLKFHSRMFPHSSQDFPSLRTNVGAVFSAAVTGAEKSDRPLASLRLAYVWSSLYLYTSLAGRGIYGADLRDSMAGLSSSDTANVIEMILTLPSTLGGFPIATWVDFVYKGGSDPLSKDLSSLVLLQKTGHSRLADRILSGLADKKLFANPAPSFNLLRDPYSIPLRKPVTPIDGVAQETMAQLLPFIMNHQIKEVVSDDTSTYLEELSECLVAVRPFNPLVLRDILECSVYGIADTLSKMFVATRTLQGVARVTGGSLIHRAMDLERLGLRYLVQRYRDLPSSPWTPTTIYDLTVALRHRWVEGGVPFPEGVTSYHPFDFPVTRASPLEHIDCITAVLTSTPEVALATRGRFDPYVGSKTREKRSEHGYRIVRSDTTSESFRKLQLIMSQGGSDPRFRDLLDTVGFSRSYTRLSSITGYLRTVAGGLMYHRYASRAGWTDAFNIGSPNFLTHCVVSADKAGDLSTSNVDYAFMLQVPYLINQWVLQEEATTGTLISHAIGIDMSDHGMEPLPSLEFTVDKKGPYPLMRYVDNDLAFLDYLSLSRLPGMVSQRSLRVCKSTSTIQVIDPVQRRHIVEGWMRETLRIGAAGREALDKEIDLFATRQMDLAEVASLGLEEVSSAVANIAADEYIGTGIWALIAGKDRWRGTTAIHRLCSVMVAGFSQFLTHPRLRSDPLVRRERIYDRPHYTEGGGYPSKRLVAITVRAALQRLRSHDPSFLLRSVGFFPGAVGGHLAHLISGAVLRALLHAWWENELSSQELLLTIDRQLRPAIKLATDEDTKINVLIGAVRSLQALAQNLQAYHLAESMETVISGSSIHLYRVSPAEAIRYTRTLRVIEGVPLSARFRPAPPSFAAAEQSLPSADYTGIPRFRGVDWRDSGLSLRIGGRHPSPEAVAEPRVSAPGMPHGVVNIHRWQWAAPIVQGKTIILVGAGFGGAAVSFLKEGAIHVYGLDLQEDVPLRPQRFVSYVPPLVLENGLEEYYTQCLETFTTTGDWYQPAVYRGVMSNDPGDAVVVIDIEGGLGSDAILPLHNLASDRHKGNVLLRAQLLPSEITRIADGLTHAGIRWRVHKTPHGTRSPGLDIVFHVSGIRPFSIPVISSSLLAWPDRTPDNIPLVPKDMGDILSDAARNIVSLHDCTSALEATSMVYWFYSEGKGDYASRASYHRWTDTLWALVGLVWACHPPPRRLELLSLWTHLGEAAVQLRGETIRVHMTRGLRRHLTKTCAYIPFP